MDDWQITAALLIRKIDRKATLLLDEGDAAFGAEEFAEHYAEFSTLAIGRRKSLLLRW